MSVKKSGLKCQFFNIIFYKLKKCFKHKNLLIASSVDFFSNLILSGSVADRYWFLKNSSCLLLQGPRSHFVLGNRSFGQTDTKKYLQTSESVKCSWRSRESTGALRLMPISSLSSFAQISAIFGESFFWKEKLIIIQY